MPYVWKIIETKNDSEIGTIIGFDKDSINIKTLNGAIGLTEIQLQGKTKIKVKDYLNGNNKFQIGTKVV